MRAAKIWLIIISIGLAGAKCYAQKGIDIGFKAGITDTRLIWELRQSSNFPSERVESKRKIGYYFQVSANLIKGKNWDWNSSLGVLQKNGEFPFYVIIQNRYNTSTNVEKWTYLTFTNLFRRTFKLSELFSVVGNVGPRVDYLINNSHNSFSQGGAFFYTDNGDINKFNFGANAGLGVMLNFNNRIKVGLEGTRSFNFNKIMSAKGPRADGLGDNGFYFRIKDSTYIINTVLLIPL